MKMLPSFTEAPEIAVAVAPPQVATVTAPGSPPSEYNPRMATRLAPEMVNVGVVSVVTVNPWVEVKLSNPTAMDYTLICLDTYAMTSPEELPLPRMVIRNPRNEMLANATAVPAVEVG